ncbi:WW domain binding protein 4, partial [Spiromyces aspiralis]
SEYWVSNKKYWCRYCKIFIADDKPSRTIHDNGRKHKENVQKFLSDLERDKREKQKQDAKLQKTLEKIEQAALESYQRDITNSGGEPVQVHKPSDSGRHPSSRSAVLAGGGQSGGKLARPAGVARREAPVRVQEARRPDAALSANDSLDIPRISEWEPVETTTTATVAATSRETAANSSNDKQGSKRRDESAKMQGEEWLDPEDDPEYLASFRLVEK